MQLFDQFIEKSKLIEKSKPRHQRDNRAIFVFDWDVDELDGNIVGIIKDLPLFDHDGKPIRGSSLIYEERGVGGWDGFFDASDLKVSGRYRWEGTYYAHRNYEGEWDCCWDVISFEPANRKTRKALEAYEKQQKTA